MKGESIMYYRSNVCKCSCSRHEDDLRNWCQYCRDEWEAEQEQQFELRRLGDAWDADAAIRPATAEEWATHLEEVAPCVQLSGCS